MPDDYGAIDGLSGEQLVERAQALAFEVEYWQHVLDDGAKINDGVLAASNAVLEATSTALGLTLSVPAPSVPSIEKIVTEHRRALEALRSIGEALDGVLTLADGRRKALEPIVGAIKRAAGVEPDDGDQVDDDDAA